MCKFSEANKRKLGNALVFAASKAKFPYKTEMLKLLYLMEEEMVVRYHTPLLGIPYHVWRMGPVSIDVFEELSDGPQLLEDYIALQPNELGNKVITKRPFDDGEFSDAELLVMEDVMARYGEMTSEQLIQLTHKKGSPWYKAAESAGLISAFDEKQANSSSVVIDFGSLLCDDARRHYVECLEVREMANSMRD